MDSLNVGLHAMSAGEDGAMVLTIKGFNGFGIDRRFFGFPGSDVFAAVVRLTDRLIGQGVIFFQVMVNVNSE